MAWFALAVSVVLTAALAVVFRIFYRRLLGRVIALESFTPYRYAVEEKSDGAPTYKVVMPTGTMDVVGAWAAEQERLGRHVDDEEIEVQRRMWAAEA